MPKLILILLFACLFTGCRKSEEQGNPAPPPAYVPPSLINHSVVLGNKNKGTLDTFLLQFNKPVRVKGIRLLSNLCLPDIEKSSNSDSTIIKFSGLRCGTLGGDYSFEISMEDKEGKRKLDTATFSYYSRRLKTQGQIIHSAISSDNKFCWVTTINPNRLYRFGLEDSTLNLQIDLNFSPSRFAFNPYNQKIYLLNYFAYSTTSDRIYVVNPTNGSIEKIITVEKDNYDDPQTHLTLYGLAFGYNGYGVLLTGTRENTKHRPRVLDSRAHDTIYTHPQWVAQLSASDSFLDDVISCEANYNATKFYCRQQYAYPAYEVFDVSSETFTKHFYPIREPNHWTVVNRLTDKVFVASYTAQFILENGSYGNVSNFGNLNSGGADFTYRKNEENVVYYMNWNSQDAELMVLDYDKGSIVTSCLVRLDFKNLRTTTDGKFLVAQNGEALFLYQTKMFYAYP